MTVKGCGPKTGGVLAVLGGVKYRCLQYQRQFARSPQILEFHIFGPPNAAFYTVPPGAHAPFPPPLKTAVKTT